MDSFDLGLAVLRLGVGVTFALHGAQKVFGWWGGPGMKGWTGAMAGMGFRPAGLFAWVSALAELLGGVALAVGFATPVVAAILVAQSLVIIGQVHWRNGFFNGKGGYEFPFVLGAASVALLLTGPGTLALDAAAHLDATSSARVGLLLLGLAAGLATLGIPRLEALLARPTASRQA